MHHDSAAVDPAAEKFAITVTDAGFTPATVTIPRDRPVVLVITRESETTCAADIYFTLPDGTKVARQLPLHVPVAIPLRVDTAAEIPYRCGMDMEHGTIVVK